MNFPLWKLQLGLYVLRIEVLLDHPHQQPLHWPRTTKLRNGKVKFSPRISFRGTCSNICPWSFSFLPPLSTPTKHTFTLGRQRSDRPAQQEKNIHSNFYSSFMQMTLVKLERSGIWENSSNKSENRRHLIGVVKDRPLFTFIRRMYLQSYLTTLKGKLTYK